MPSRDILHGGCVKDRAAGSADKNYKEPMHAGRAAQVETARHVSKVYLQGHLDCTRRVDLVL